MDDAPGEKTLLLPAKFYIDAQRASHLRELLARAPVHDVPRAFAGFSHHKALGNALCWSSGATEAASDDATRRAAAALLLLLLPRAALLRFSRPLSAGTCFWNERVGCVACGAGIGGWAIRSVPSFFVCSWGTLDTVRITRCSCFHRDGTSHTLVSKLVSLQLSLVSSYLSCHAKQHSHR